MRIRSVLTHSGEALFEGLLIALLVVGLVAGTAFAGKGGAHGKPGGGGSTTGNGSITLATPLVVDHNGNGLPDYTDVVTFNISTTATATPYVNLLCYQGSTLVANGWRGYWDGSIDTSWNFGLESGAWPGGAADCTAYLKMQTKSGWSILASTRMPVGA